jgi:Mn-dependent DtxR family transcriptional regulator
MSDKSLRSREILLTMLYDSGSDPTMPEPSLTDLGAGIGTNRQTAHYHLRKLRDDGLVDWIDGRHGSRVLTNAGVREAKRIKRRHGGKHEAVT